MYVHTCASGRVRHISNGSGRAPYFNLSSTKQKKYKHEPLVQLTNLEVEVLSPPYRVLSNCARLLLPLHNGVQSSQSVNPGEWRIANLLLSSPSNRAPAEVSHVPPLQSPEIALIRSQSEPRQRVSGRALRLSTEATSPLSPEGIHAQKRRSSSLSPSSRKPRTSPEAAIAEDRGEGGHVRGDSISDAAAGAASRDGTSAPSMIAACESDIWAWALMVLQMFSDEAWPPGRGQVRTPCH